MCGTRQTNTENNAPLTGFLTSVGFASGVNDGIQKLGSPDFFALLDELRAAELLTAAAPATHSLKKEMKRTPLDLKHTVLAYLYTIK